MIDRAEITARVEKIYEGLRLENLQTKERRTAEVSAALPEYTKIEKSISGAGIRLVSLASKGRKGTEEYKDAENELMRLGTEREELLKKGGFPADYLDGCCTCAKCGDTGRTVDDNGVPVYCDCYRKNCVDVILEESGIPVKKGFEAFDIGIFAASDRPAAERLLADAKEFVSDFANGRNRLFYGKAGVGKTFLASITATELIRTGVFAVYATVPMLMQTLLYYGDDERLQERRDNVFEIVQNADLLVLDELGTERMTPARQDMLEVIIDGIVADPARKCIVISNLDMKEMMSAYGERMFSRLASMKLVRFELPATGDLRMKVR